MCLERSVTYVVESTETLRLDWGQVGAIRSDRRGGSQTYTVIGRDGAWVDFSYYTFFRPNKLAQLIARRSGQPIQRA